ncbi:TetR/AcrR family transcriptional regulator [Paenibacillus sp. NPDC057967]|uniref:TetR/AcrR family transcriptional regulator n=1 Tax=Paenibacillus sp. NPDC057967 TaxID=3346293 RepID=UPI0036DEDFDB
MEVSIDLFSRQGFNAVSIRDITGLVGIKKSTLYYHFKNKEHILSSIFAEYREVYRNMFPPAFGILQFVDSAFQIMIDKG